MAKKCKTEKEATPNHVREETGGRTGASGRLGRNNAQLAKRRNLDTFLRVPI